MSNDLAKVSAKIESAKFFACELWVERVGTFGVVLYRNQWPVNFNLHFGELYSDNSINDKHNLFENYIPKCYKVKRILISFNCFSEYKTLSIGWESRAIRYVRGGRKVSDFTCSSEIRCFYPNGCWYKFWLLLYFCSVLFFMTAKSINPVEIPHSVAVKLLPNVSVLGRSAQFDR